MEPPPLTVLVVEDNLSHQKITEYGLKKSAVPLSIRVVRDGEEALDYLFRRSTYAEPSTSPTPDLILLDLNIPKRDGREVLLLIKKDPSTKEIPVVIVSTSDREEDVAFAFQTGAVAYISKSSGFDKLNEQLAGVHAYARRPDR